jgi:hypothetical protein
LIEIQLKKNKKESEEKVELPKTSELKKMAKKQKAKPEAAKSETPNGNPFAKLVETGTQTEKNSASHLPNESEEETSLGNISKDHDPAHNEAYEIPSEAELKEECLVGFFSSLV